MIYDTRLMFHPQFLCKDFLGPLARGIAYVKDGWRKQRRPACPRKMDLFFFVKSAGFVDVTNVSKEVSYCLEVGHVFFNDVIYIYTYVTVIYLYISRISRLNLRMLVLLFLWDFRFGGDEISNVDRVVTGSRWFLSGLPEQVIHSIEKSYHLIGWWAIGDFRIPKFGYIFPRNLQQDLMNGPLHLSI